MARNPDDHGTPRSKHSGHLPARGIRIRAKVQHSPDRQRLRPRQGSPASDVPGKDERILLVRPVRRLPSTLVSTLAPAAREEGRIRR
jgi:hypothetical protein